MTEPLFRLAGRLPLIAVQALGGLLGWTAYALAPRYRRRLRENLRAAALCPDPRAFEAMARSAAAHAGKSVAELLVVWLRPLPSLARLVRATAGWEHVEAAQQAGRGIIFLTPHMGCFEITSLYYGRTHPITVLYRPPRKARLEPLMLRGRRRGGVTLAPTDMKGVRALLSALKRGEAIGMLPDQVPSRGEGVWVDFFGRPAYTMTLAARLAETTGATLLLAYARRLNYGRGFELRIEPVRERWPVPKEAAATALNRAVEGLIAQCPEQYLWSYNRYKVPRGVEPPARAAGGEGRAGEALGR
ncbi:MAG: lysophospholipid acyltransferase family protein [Betaproteobacteria bacterium]|nr:lysophospholipid acyltransferase family protein [Betaproteobacteria bacterium]